MSTSAPTYCPNCGATLVMAEAAGRQRPVCPECGFVYYHNPVPAVGLLIEQEGGLVLVKRGQPPDVGKWAFPSGFIEADENVEGAAVREAEEETGLEIALQEMVGVFSFPDGPPTSGIIVFYRASPVGGSLRAGDDAVEVRVFAPQEIPELPFRTHREALARWRVSRSARTGGMSQVTREDFHIREATPGDADRVLALARLIPGKVPPHSGMSQVIFQRLQDSMTLVVYVAETFDPTPQVIGFAAFTRMLALTDNLGWIDAMAVDPAFRRIGVGAALLEAILRRAERLGIREMYVNTEQASDIARAFYRSSGFQEGAVTRLRLRA